MGSLQSQCCPQNSVKEVAPNGSDAPDWELLKDKAPNLSGGRLERSSIVSTSEQSMSKVKKVVIEDAVGGDAEVKTEEKKKGGHRAGTGYIGANQLKQMLAEEDDSDEDEDGKPKFNDADASNHEAKGKVRMGTGYITKDQLAQMDLSDDEEDADSDGPVNEYKEQGDKKPPGKEALPRRPSLLNTDDAEGKRKSSRKSGQSVGFKDDVAIHK
eukprot:gnl/MRDRNA2_/MRDRNA2_105475_c0_seq1.p1 gnl/MRDRNA2_/MRDRNA2_105475_c0~~gnl/MRDRNA2_/MRDRNA2_105475_c0_seq1.p1  ORF type:complete len:213 (+),score=68.94 gnl/MRDRNA2_/MRDRNA2_105475_c0_seq1:95-733(+)